MPVTQSDEEEEPVSQRRINSETKTKNKKKTKTMKNYNSMTDERMNGSEGEQKKRESDDGNEQQKRVKDMEAYDTEEEPETKKLKTETISWNGTYKKNFAMKVAKVYMPKEDFFPSKSSFVIDNDDINSFSSIMKRSMKKSFPGGDIGNFEEFFYKNKKTWYEACNSLRTIIVNKCKTKYFSKLFCCHH